MRVYTIKDIENFEKDEYGRTIYPSGDYTQIDSFGEGCSFGDGCNLENNLKFENIEDAVDRVLKIDRIGSRRGCTYFFKTLSEIYVRCGCFFGTISEFENQVNETHKDNSRYLLEYTEAIKYAKTVLEVEK